MTGPQFAYAAAALLLSAIAAAQSPAPAQPAPVAQSIAQPAAVPTLPKPLPNLYRNLIVLDPAHGGPDRGAALTDGAAEKDVVLSFAQKLRPALVAQGFTVAATRDSDPTDGLTSDQRAGIANHARPLACLLLHATGAGAGVHVVTSPLESAEASSARGQRWDEAQAGSVRMSLRLANEIGLAMMASKLPVVLLRASVPPVDNLTCAAVVVEVGPLLAQDKGRTPATDAAYQQRVADAIAQALASFRTHNAPAPTTTTPTAATGSSAARPSTAKPATNSDQKKGGAPR